MQHRTNTYDNKTMKVLQQNKKKKRTTKKSLSHTHQQHKVAVAQRQLATTVRYRVAAAAPPFVNAHQ